MFNEQEIEALVLGARIIESWADAELATAASNVIAKVGAVIPDGLRRFMANTALLAPPDHHMEPIRFDLAELRRALRQQLKVYFHYCNALNEESERTVRPLVLAYFGPLDSCGMVRTARRLPILPARPHGRLRGPSGPVPRRVRQDASGFPEARQHLDTGIAGSTFALLVIRSAAFRRPFLPSWLNYIEDDSGAVR